MDIMSKQTSPLYHIISQQGSKQLLPLGDVFPQYKDRELYPCHQDSILKGRLVSPFPPDAVTFNDFRFQKLLIKFNMSNGCVVNPYLGIYLVQLMRWNAVIIHGNMMLAHPLDKFLKTQTPLPMLSEETFNYFQDLAERSIDDRKRELHNWYEILLSKHKSYIMAQTYADMYYEHSDASFNSAQFYASPDDASCIMSKST